MASVAEMMLKQYEEDFGKAFAGTSAYDFSNGAVTVIPFPDTVKIWGGVKTPLPDRIANERAVAITDQWEDVEIAAPAENKQAEGILASALTGTTVTPAKRTNTCQIVSAKLPVTGSAIREARNGVYGRALQDLMNFQIRVKLPTLVASIALSAWFGVEVTDASAAEDSAREMSGLIGTAGAGGYDDGLLTTAGRATVTDLSGDEITGDAVDDWLETIAEAGASADDMPTAIYGPLRFMRAAAKFDNCVAVIETRAPGSGRDVTVGVRATQYWAPWGKALDLVWEPQNKYSSTVAINNWLAALCEPNLAMRSLAGSPTEGGMEIINPGVLGDQEIVQFLWEGCIKAEVFKGHGVMKDWYATIVS